MHSTIGVITNETGKHTDINGIINTLMQINKMADCPNKSNYLIERQKISGENSIQNCETNNKILIYETDEALGILLNTILNLQGYSTEIINEYNIDRLDKQPAVIIIDAGDLEKRNGLNLCCAIKQKEELKNSKIIVTSIIHDKELVLNTGADLYLPKPYEIPQLIKWVDSFIKEFND